MRWQVTLIEYGILEKATAGFSEERSWSVGRAIQQGSLVAFGKIISLYTQQSSDYLR